MSAPPRPEWLWTTHAGRAAHYDSLRAYIEHLEARIEQLEILLETERDCYRIAATNLAELEREARD